MIYLFEDRKERMKMHLGDRTFEEIKEAIFDCTKKDIVSFVAENFRDAQCVLFHKSYIFPEKNITIQEVQEIFKKLNIPCVIFSGGSHNNMTTPTTGYVDSANMYKNLPLFVESIKLGRVNLAVLIYGEKYLLNELLKLQWKIHHDLFNFDAQKELSSDETDAINDYLKSFTLPEASDDINKLSEWLVASDSKLKTPETVKSRLQKLIDSHE